MRIIEEVSRLIEILPLPDARSMSLERSERRQTTSRRERTKMNKFPTQFPSESEQLVERHLNPQSCGVNQSGPFAPQYDAA
jgi:hypothetical protein